MIPYRIATPARSILTSVLLRGGMACLGFLAFCTSAANSQTSSAASTADVPVHVTHVLGFESVPRNTRGNLSVQGDALRFQRNGTATAQISISSIRHVFVGDEDRQVGGVPLTLGKAAVPFGGGRVVSLFSHKGYDGVVVEYRDASGGLHAAIFQFEKEEGEIFKMGLVARGAESVSPPESAATLQTTLDDPVQPQKWSVQVETIDPGDTALEPSFSAAIYENLLRHVRSSEQFSSVFRSGDRNAATRPGVLVLKTRVEKYSAGSETRRAVTTVAGATKIKVHIELVAPNGDIVTQHTVEGDIRFMGDNLKAPDKVASKTAKLLKKSGVPPPAALMAQHTIPKEAAAR